jgi:hypothetical protein
MDDVRIRSAIIEMWNACIDVQTAMKPHVVELLRVDTSSVICSSLLFTHTFIDALLLACVPS